MSGRGKPSRQARGRKRRGALNSPPPADGVIRTRDKRLRQEVSTRDEVNEGHREEPEIVQLSAMDGEDDGVSQGRLRQPLLEDIVDFDKVWDGEIFRQFGQASDHTPVPPEAERQNVGCPDVDMIRCGAEDMTAHVPKTLREKIINNEYVNICLLLKNNTELGLMFSGGLLHLNQSGAIEMRQPMQTKEKIQSIEKWTDAFLIFMAVYITKHADKMGQLLQYMSVIREAAIRDPCNFSWRTYDEQFRMRQSLDLKPWNVLNSDLWLRVMTFPSVQAPQTSLRPMSSVVDPRPCKDFNKGFCSWYCCRFKHSCELCGSSEHGMFRCPSRHLNGPRTGGQFMRGSFRSRGFTRGRGQYQGQAFSNRPSNSTK